MEPIFVAVLANDSAEIAAIAANTAGAVDQRVEQDLLVTELPHMLYRGDTPPAIRGRRRQPGTRTRSGE